MTPMQFVGFVSKFHVIAQNVLCVSPGLLVPGCDGLDGDAQDQSSAIVPYGDIRLLGVKIPPDAKLLTSPVRQRCYARGGKSQTELLGDKKCKFS